MEYGYVRVSSLDQNEDRQMTALRDAAVPEKNILQISSLVRILNVPATKN